ncbi:MAG TPA: hypothetical protein VGG78_03455 [Gemmatimonadaceae bacterium]|jgi:hypothetical protein
MLHLRSALCLRAAGAVALSVTLGACTVIPAAAPDRTHAEALADLRAMLRDVGAAQAQWHSEHASFATPAVLLGRVPSALRAGVLIDSVDVSPVRWYVRAQQADTGDRCWVVGSAASEHGRETRAKISCEAAPQRQPTAEIADAGLE